LIAGVDVGTAEVSRGNPAVPAAVQLAEQPAFRLRLKWPTRGGAKRVRRGRAAIPAAFENDYGINLIR
jgi:hypothetical protein